MKPGRAMKTNVEFYAAAVLQGVGLSPDLFPATFGLARIAGWSAHAIEQAGVDKIIRPDAKSSAPGLASGAKQKLKGCGVKKSSTCQVKNIRRQVIKSPSILKNRPKTPMSSLPKFRTGHSSRSLVNSKTK